MGLGGCGQRAVSGAIPGGHSVAKSILKPGLEWEQRSKLSLKH